MKKTITTVLLGGLLLGSMESCTSTSAASTASTMGTNVLTNLATALLQMLGNIPALKGASLTTNLSSVLKDQASISSFKNLLSTNYKIPMSKINSSYSSFGTVQDVVNFVGQNANSTILNSYK